jgi:sulfite exporter TauE/SafE
VTNLWLIFVTGLTTGGLSCMAVQGGLLATAVADEKRAQGAAPAKTIGLFLAAKIVAYTALGFLLGWLGTVVQLSTTTRGVIQAAVAIFLIGTALRMLDVHPIFRIFAIQPPKALTRWLRRFSKDGADDHATPIFLGALTVLIPCGVTQAMMALALSTTSPWQGALLMASFTLGTTPVFFGLSYLATKLGQTLQHRFALVTAVLILGLGLYSIEGALNVLGSPISLAALRQSWSTSAETVVVATSASPTNSETSPAASPTEKQPMELTINVSDEGGYEPQSVKVPAETPLKLTFVSGEVFGCVSAIVFPSLKQSLYLDQNDRQTMDIPAQKAGTVLRYSCAMGMYTARINFT